MKTFRFFSFLLALVLATPSIADQRDRDRNDHGRYNRGYDRGYDNHRYERNYGNNRHRGDRYDNVSVNLSFGGYPGRWAPGWSYGHSDWNDRSFSRNTFVFNSSLGYLPSSLVTYVSSPRVVYQQPYTRSYNEPVYRDSGVSLLKDRFGQCYERETDRNGNEIRRRVADHRCNF